MPRHRGPRGKGNADKANGNGGGKRAAPYETRRGNNYQQASKGGDAGGRKNGGGKGKNGGGGGGGRGGRGRGRGGRGDKPKPKTAEDLDREMDSYWGKSEEHAQKKLDSDMDDYWKNKDATKADADADASETVVEDKVGEPAAAAAEATDDKAE